MNTLYSTLLEAIFVKTGGRKENPEIAKACTNAIENDENNFVLVKWPYTQIAMDQDWFDKEGYLANNPHTYSEVGNSAYFVPAKRVDLIMELNK